MKEINDGGPAFPVREDYSESQGRYVQYASDGMSKRDYFAAKAMQGIIASGNLIAQHNIAAENQLIESVSRSAYKYADAMIAEGSK